MLFEFYRTAIFLNNKISCHFCYVIIILNLLIYSAFIRSVKSDSKVKLKFYSNMVTFLYEKECPHTGSVEKRWGNFLN